MRKGNVLQYTSTHGEADTSSLCYFHAQPRPVTVHKLGSDSASTLDPSQKCQNRTATMGMGVVGRRFVTSAKHLGRLQDSFMSRRAAEIQREQRKKKQEGGRSGIV